VHKHNEVCESRIHGQDLKLENVDRHFLIGAHPFYFLAFFRKVVAYVAAAGAGIHAMFFSDYDIQGFENQEHVFSNVQKDTRHWIDRNIYGIEQTKSKPDEASRKS
jgi:hypothetical protein